MVDATTSIVKLALMLAKVPESVRINHDQCQLLVDRISCLAGHLERMQGVNEEEQLEQSHQVSRSVTNDGTGPCMVVHLQSPSPPKLNVSNSSSSVRVIM